jgi:hypothetical protein
MKPPEHIFGTLKPFGHWVQECGWAASYGWRMRKRRMVTTINIAGKHYISADEVERFLARAREGAFAQEPRMPSSRPRKGATTTSQAKAGTSPQGEHGDRPRHEVAEINKIAEASLHVPLA